MKILDLFSGTGSVSKVAKELGYDVVSLDISNQYHQPSIQVNVLVWNYSSFPVGYFDIIWASPPCNTFSRINRLKYSREQQDERINRLGLPLLRRTEEIIDYFQPRRWVIENPQGRMQDYIKNKKLFVVDYCQYENFGYRKRTNIWTNHPHFEPLICRKNCSSMDGNKHRLQISWTRGISLADRYRVPKQLIQNLIE